MSNISVTSNKKVAKMARKLMRNKISEKFRDIADIIKPRPKYVPVKVWMWLINLVIDLNIWENKSNLYARR